MFDPIRPLWWGVYDKNISATIPVGGSRLHCEAWRNRLAIRTRLIVIHDSSEDDSLAQIEGSGVPLKPLCVDGQDARMGGHRSSVPPMPIVK
jgi:hypothetical protein